MKIKEPNRQTKRYWELITPKISEQECMEKMFLPSTKSYHKYRPHLFSQHPERLIMNFRQLQMMSTLYEHMYLTLEDFRKEDPDRDELTEEMVTRLYLPAKYLLTKTRIAYNKLIKYNYIEAKMGVGTRLTNVGTDEYEFQYYVAKNRCAYMVEGEGDGTENVITQKPERLTSYNIQAGNLNFVRGPKRRFTDEQIREIREITGKKVREIGEMYKISAGMVSAIRNYKTYRDVK